MRFSMLVAVALALAVAGDPAFAQQNPAAPAADPSASAAVLAVPRPLPPALVPAREVAASEMAFVQEESPMVPVLFGIFGGIAGMFVADWWVDRNCTESCGQADIPMLFLGGALGAVLGYLIGGGELPEQPPGGR